MNLPISFDLLLNFSFKLILRFTFHYITLLFLLEFFVPISMSDALYILSDAQKMKKANDYGMQNNSAAAFGGLGMMLNEQEEVVNKTQEYLKKFCRITDKNKIKELKAVAKDNGIHLDYAIKICDLGLTEYDEAVSLYPELDPYEKSKVQDLLYLGF